MYKAAFLLVPQSINLKLNYVIAFRFRDDGCYTFLFLLADNRLFESANTLRGENLQLSIANEKLRTEAASGTPGSAAHSALETKLLAQADELAALHRRRGEHAQKIVDLNNKLTEVSKELQIKETRYFQIC